MMLTRASEVDVPVVLDLLNDSADWLRSRGSDQWAAGFTGDRIARIVASGGTYIAWDLGDPVATITVNGAGDPALWAPRELAEPASYLSKMATARQYAGRGIGDALMSWAVDAADRRGDRWVRLDAWRSNSDLQRYYAERRWTYVRTEVAPGRNSGALFQRLALPTQHPFTSAPDLPARSTSVPAVPLPVGAKVFTRGWQEGTVIEVAGPDWTHEVVSRGWEHGVGHPSISYRVRLEDGSEVVLPEGDVTDAASVAAVGHL
jgi:GNAT superfamily N-acetyltransferase